MPRRRCLFPCGRKVQSVQATSVCSCPCVDPKTADRTRNICPDHFPCPRGFVRVRVGRTSPPSSTSTLARPPRRLSQTERFREVHELDLKVGPQMSETSVRCQCRRRTCARRELSTGRHTHTRWTHRLVWTPTPREAQTRTGRLFLLRPEVKHTRKGGVL